MTSQKKLSANRCNAQRSTGPKSAGGKARSRYNAVKTGLHATQRPLPNEDLKAYGKLSRRLTKRYAPEDPVGELIVDQILGHIWRIQRLERAEKAYFEAIEEARSIRQARFACVVNVAFTESPPRVGETPKVQLLSDKRNARERPNSEAQLFDDLDGIFLEAAISRNEGTPLRYLSKQRSAHMHEIFWLEGELNRRRRAY